MQFKIEELVYSLKQIKENNTHTKAPDYSEAFAMKRTTIKHQNNS
jgi:hypothetical protein